MWFTRPLSVGPSFARGLIRNPAGVAENRAEEELQMWESSASGSELKSWEWMRLLVEDKLTGDHTFQDGEEGRKKRRFGSGEVGGTQTARRGELSRGESHRAKEYRTAEQEAARGLGKCEVSGL